MEAFNTHVPTGNYKVLTGIPNGVPPLVTTVFTGVGALFIFMKALSYIMLVLDLFVLPGINVFFNVFFECRASTDHFVASKIWSKRYMGSCHRCV